MYIREICGNCENWTFDPAVIGISRLGYCTREGFITFSFARCTRFLPRKYNRCFECQNWGEGEGDYRPCKYNDITYHYGIGPYSYHTCDYFQPFYLIELPGNLFSMEI